MLTDGLECCGLLDSHYISWEENMFFKNSVKERWRKKVFIPGIIQFFLRSKKCPLRFLMTFNRLTTSDTQDWNGKTIHAGCRSFSSGVNLFRNFGFSAWRTEPAETSVCFKLVIVTEIRPSSLWCFLFLSLFCFLNWWDGCDMPQKFVLEFCSKNKIKKILYGLKLNHILIGL